MDILSPCPALEDRWGKACTSEWECVMVPVGLLLDSCFIASPALGRQGSRKSWTGSKVAIDARMLGLALVPKGLHLEPTTFIFTVGMDWLLTFYPCIWWERRALQISKVPQFPEQDLQPTQLSWWILTRLTTPRRVEYTLLSYTSLPVQSRLCITVYCTCFLQGANGV